MREQNCCVAILCSTLDIMASSHNHRCTATHETDSCPRVGPEVAIPHPKTQSKLVCCGTVGPEVATPRHKPLKAYVCYGTVGPEVATPRHKPCAWAWSDSMSRHTTRTLAQGAILAAGSSSALDSELLELLLELELLLFSLELLR